MLPGGVDIASYVMLISLLNLRKPMLLVDVRIHVRIHVRTAGRRLQDATRKKDVRLHLRRYPDSLGCLSPEHYILVT